MAKLWAGRAIGASDPLADEFNTSLPIDQKLYKQDIKASIVHSAMLAKCKIISDNDAKNIEAGLLTLQQKIEDGSLKIENSEDIHMFLEEKLTDLIGESGKKMHTARSRNDQVVTDFKMYIIESISDVKDVLISFINALIKVAKDNFDTIMPGFTHLQKAQPVTLGHHMMAYAEMFLRDLDRFNDTQRRTNFCPLGAGALAGTTYSIDRFFTAEHLGFTAPTANSLDSVSDRDYVMDYCYNALTTFTHISRLAEELIIWTSNDYRYAEISDLYSTGSSIMPQKKNADMAELGRGKAGKILGNLVSICAILKSLPLAYNKDLQEDKGIFFDTEDNLLKTLVVFTRMMTTLKFNKDVMYRACQSGFINATDLADFLVSKGLAFRDAYKISGQLVRHCISDDCALDDLSLETLLTFSDKFDKNVYEAIKLENIVKNRTSYGGTAPEKVLENIENALYRLSQYR